MATKPTTDLPWLHEPGQYKGHLVNIEKRYDRFKGPYLRFEFSVRTQLGERRVMGIQTDVSWLGWRPKRVSTTQYTIGNWEGNWPSNQWLRALGFRRIKRSIILDKLLGSQKRKPRTVIVDARSDGKYVKVYNIKRITKTAQNDSQIFDLKVTPYADPTIPPNHKNAA